MEGVRRRRDEVSTALGVLTGLAGHESCVPLALESVDFGYLLHVLFVCVFFRATFISTAGKVSSLIFSPPLCSTKTSAEYERLLERSFQQQPWASQPSGRRAGAFGPILLR